MTRPVWVHASWMCAFLLGSFGPAFDAEGAEWSIAGVTNRPIPVQPGGALELTIRLRGAGDDDGAAVQVAVSTPNDPTFQATVDAVPTGPNTRTAVIEYPVPDDAAGVWRFEFQLYENGRRGIIPLIHMVSIARPGEASEAGPPTPLAAPQGPAPTAGIDLAVSVVPAPDAIRGAPGEIRVLRYRVNNLGDQSAGDARVRYGSDLRSESSPVNVEFTPGMQIVGMMEFEIEAEMREFFIEAIARGQDDARPDNNRIAVPVEITTPSNHDLALRELIVVGAPRAIASGSSLDVQALIQNLGENPVETETELTLEGLDGEPLKAVAPPLRPNEAFLAAFQGRVSGAPDGRLSLLGVLDSNRALRETDEANNFQTLDLSDRLTAAGAATDGLPSAAVRMTPFDAQTSTADISQQDVSLSVLRSSTLNPRPYEQVQFFIHANRDTVRDVEGDAQNLENFLFLYPRGLTGERLAVRFDSKLPDNQDAPVYQFTASFAYGLSDGGQQIPVVALFQPPDGVPDADVMNNAQTLTVTVGEAP